MGCILWVLPLIDILPQFLQWRVQYLVILGGVIMALDCIMFYTYHIGRFALDKNFMLRNNRCIGTKQLHSVTGTSQYYHHNVNACVNSLGPRQNGRHFPDDIFKCIFFNENVWISIKTSLKFVPEGPINNIPSLVQIMAWRRPGDKPLSEPMTVRLSTHICVTRPQWVNTLRVSVCRC